MNAVIPFRAMKLPGSAPIVLACLIIHADRNGLSVMDYPEIMAFCEIGRNSVADAIKSLSAKKFIHKIKKGNNPTVYNINPCEVGKTKLPLVVWKSIRQSVGKTKLHDSCNGHDSKPFTKKSNSNSTVVPKDITEARECVRSPLKPQRSNTQIEPTMEEMELALELASHRTGAGEAMNGERLNGKHHAAG